MSMSEIAIEVASVLRDYVGKNNERPSPGSATQIIELFRDRDYEASKLREALNELVLMGFIRLDTSGLGPGKIPGVPHEFRDVVGLEVMEPLQEYFDDMEN